MTKYLNLILAKSKNVRERCGGTSLLIFLVTDLKGVDLRGGEGGGRVGGSWPTHVLGLFDEISTRHRYT